MGSKRAEILSKTVPHINSGRYFAWEGHLVFGSASFEELAERITSTPGHTGTSRAEELLFRLVDHVVTHFGREEVSKRVTLGVPPIERMDFMMDFSSDEIGDMLQLIKRYSLEREATLNQPTATSDTVGDPDSIDAALTQEMLGKLPKAVDRASKLNRMGLDRIADQAIKKYFEEAHRCFLYGFNVACAVLSRAILESALKSVCDPDKSIKLVGDESYFRKLIEKAEKQGLLTGDNPKCAIQVRDCGNAAIHDYQEFQRKWVPKLGKVVESTRKVLLDLFEAQTCGPAPDGL